ncbi:MAG: hypothetical protein AB7G17_06180 [Phycisphaerales bacterium]
MLGSLTVTAWRMPDIMESVSKNMNPSLAMGMKSAIGPDALSLLQAQAQGGARAAEPLKAPAAEELVLFGGAGLSEAQKAALLREAARRAPANPPKNTPSFGGGKASSVRSEKSPSTGNGTLESLEQSSLEELTKELQKVMQKGG